ncbi:MAG: Demethylrebeccamycin-D-glucose O-methyltransferase [Candidatus Heimdallarchaeota archaeon LC_2]|nr:MAG: Demethylrebeccamycin-D-glucose O-methyltransferase [Candidatus Heimdallarchaeota archaeon LC_2]
MENIFQPLLQNNDYESCCTSFYENDMVKFLLGNSFHPGGMKLTNRLANKLELNENSKVLDVASGLGASSIEIAKKFGANVIGIDLSTENINTATLKAEKLGLSNIVKFQVANAENLPFPDNYFDSIISECSFCIFPDKEKVTSEMYRVLKPGGFLGISDVVIEKNLPSNLEHMIFRVSCISDAQSVPQYLSYFNKGGFTSIEVEDQKNEILELHKSIKKKVFLLEVAKNMKRNQLEKIDLGYIDFNQVNKWVDYIKQFVESGYGSYTIIVGKKPIL